MCVRHALPLLLLVLAAPSGWAQKGVPAPVASEAARQSTPGCALGSARVFLDGGDVTAPLYNTGSLFWRSTGDYLYEVPSGSGLRAIFAAGLWVSGEVGGEVRFAGSTYGPWEFWPGPLDAGTPTTGDMTTQARCAQFDQFWKVRRSDIEQYAQGGSAFPLESWPVAQGAPFYVDANGNSLRDAAEPRLVIEVGDDGYSPTLGQGRQIDLAAGERPDIVGDQGIWWVMNDAGNAKVWSGDAPLGVEVQVLAYVFQQGTGGFGSPLPLASFYEYTVINRSTETIADARVSLYTDFDLGDYTDDYVASDPSRGLAIGYNADENDAVNLGGYGSSPPAVGVDFLSGAAGVHYFANGGGVIGDPAPPDDRGLVSARAQDNVWKDGVPMTVGGTGYNPGSDDRTRWAFSGDPVTFDYWTEEQPTPTGRASPTGDRRFIVNAEPVSLAPGESRRVDVAILTALGGRLPGTDNEQRTRLHNVSRLRDISDAVQDAYDAGGVIAIRDAEVTYSPLTPAPQTATTLVAPADGTDLSAESPAAVTFEWVAVAEADAYVLALSADADFTSTAAEFRTAGTSVTIGADDLPAGLGRTYWRVTAASAGGEGPPSPVRSFVYPVYLAEIVSFEVVANANGPVVPAEPAAAAYQDYPTPDAGNPSEAQQSNGTRWFVSVATLGTFEDFLEFALRDDNASRFFPDDYEARFTGTSTAYRGLQDNALVTIPFEIWNIGSGTPDDASDDYRMVPMIGDVDNDGTYNLSALDSPVSSANNDPETDWIFWYDPLDTSPGEAGYLAWEAGAATDPTAVGGEVLAYTTFVGWNLGTAPPYAAPHPEAGTVFRILTSNPLRATSADAGVPAAGLELSVHPNPVAATATVPFRLAAPARVRLAVVDVLGREVAVLADGPREGGEHRATFDAGRLAAGVYVIVLETPGARVTRTVTVVR